MWISKIDVYRKQFFLIVTYEPFFEIVTDAKECFKKAKFKLHDISYGFLLAELWKKKAIYQSKESLKYLSKLMLTFCFLESNRQTIYAYLFTLRTYRVSLAYGSYSKE